MLTPEHASARTTSRRSLDKVAWARYIAPVIQNSIGQRFLVNRLLRDAGGTPLRMGNREVRVRARRARGERLRDAVDRAYAEKYPTRGSLKYVRGLRTPRRRETTTEFVRATTGKS